MYKIDKGSLWISLNPYQGEGQFKVINVDYKWGLASVEILNNTEYPDNNGMIQDIAIDTLLKYYTPYGEHISDTNNC